MPKTPLPSTTSDPTTQYALDVVEGREIAGPHVRASCRRHLKDLETGHERGLWFDVDAAQHTLDFFPDILRLNGGQFEGIPFNLHPSQKFIVGSLFGWKKGEFRRFRTAYIEQGKGNGKAEWVENEIPTKDGFKRMGDIVAGDVLFDKDGTQCVVLEAHPIEYGLDCFEVCFDTGESVVVSGQHLWEVTLYWSGSTLVVPTFELYALPHMMKYYRIGGRSIVDVKRVDSVPVRCISVSSPSQTYLTGRGKIPTHNSPMSGGVGIFGMIADGEPGAQVYAAATKTAQARILFEDAVKMVKQSPVLSSKLMLSGNNPVHTITHMKSGSFFKPISREDGKTGSGPRPHMALIDELHEHPDRNIVEMLERGFKFRQQPLSLIMTNSGSDTASYCYEVHELAVKAANGDYDESDMDSFDRLFSYVCSLDEGDDPLSVDYDEAGKPVYPVDVWKKANPLLGTILTEDYLAGVCADARGAPGKANGILRLHFCRWTDAETSWISRAAWDECVDKGLDLDDFEGQDCYLGLDLGATKDILGLSMVFPGGENDPEKRTYALFAHGFTPKDSLRERQKADKVPYDLWVQDGYLTATPGPIVSFSHVVAWIAEVAGRFNVKGLAYDRHLFNRFEEYLDEAGLSLPIFEHPQGFNRRKENDLWMPGSVDMLERLILDKRLRVAYNKALNQAVAASTFETSPAGLRRFTKAKANRRIDLAISSTMAIGIASGGSSGQKKQRSYLDTMDLLVL